MSENIISIKHLKKSYGKHQVLLDVNMHIARGDIYGLVGRNGSGKTTLFKSILGLTEFEEGELHIGDEGDSLETGRSKVGFLVGQNLFPYMTARQNLDYYRILKGIKDKGEIDRVLKLVELENVKTKVAGFSMGMKQRLGIANALLGNPEVVILDEPVNGLDPQGIADIRNLIKSLNEEYGITFLISSHILGELQNTAKKFGVLNGGVIVKELAEEDLEVSSNYVRLTVDDVEKARRVLAEAGIEVKNETTDKLNLEDYYFSLIGGEK